MEYQTNNNHSTATPLSSQLGKKIALVVVIVSICITLFTTVIQLHFEYNRVQQTIESRHSEIRDIHAKLMATSLWNVDLPMLDQRMESLVNLPYIDYLLIASDHDRFESGTPPATTNKLSHQYPLIFEDNLSGQSETLATLTVETDTSALFHRLAEIFVTELGLNLVKILLVCYVILLIFHFSINKRIFSIMEYLKQYSPQYDTNPLTLNNTRYITTNGDELAILAQETNRLTNKLTGFYQDITAEKERLSDFTQVSSDWLWETDENLNLIYCSDPMKLELDLKSQGQRTLIDCLQIEPNQSALSALLKLKSSFTHCEEKITIDNQDHFLLFQAKARFQLDQFIGFRGTTINITQLKRTQLELELLNQNLEITVNKRTQDLENSLCQVKQIQAQLIESAKLAALGGLVAGVAH
jgi:PAS domain-containing protein